MYKLAGVRERSANEKYIWLMKKTASRKRRKMANESRKRNRRK